MKTATPSTYRKQYAPRTQKSADVTTPAAPTSKKSRCLYATISMPPEAMRAAKTRAKSLGLAFSQYVAFLIRKDRATSEEFTILEDPLDKA